MIIRGGGAIGAAGFTGADACICVTLLGACAAGGTLPAEILVGAGGVITRGGIATAGGAALTEGELVEGELAAGVTGAFGGITTTDGGRYVAATEAGVTILGAGGAGVSAAGLGGIALGADGAAGGSAFATGSGVATGGLTGGRAAGGSGVPFCCVMARSTSPGREMFERSILVLMPSSA